MKKVKMSQSLRLSKTYSLCDLPDSSPKRLEKIRLASKGYTHRQIAHMLDVSYPTVKNEFGKMFIQYECRNIVELIAKAKDAGII